MKAITCSIFLCTISLLSLGQSNQKLDSLKNVLAKLPAEGRSFASDTLRVRVLCEMGEVSFDNNFEDSFKIYNEGLKLSEKLNFKSGLMTTNFQIGLLYRKKNLHLNASDYLFKALLYAETLKNNERIGYILRKIGDNYNTLESYDKSIEYYYKALPYEQKNASKYRYLICINNIGTAYFGKKEYKNALNQFLFCKSKNIPIDSVVACYYHTNMGFAYQELNEYSKAVENYEMCYKYRPFDISILAFANAGIAEVFLKQKNYPKALLYAKKSENALLIIDEPTLPLRVYNTLFQIYKSLKNSKKSLNYFEKFSQLKFAEDSIKSIKLSQSLNFIYENEKQQQKISNLNLSIQQEENSKNILKYISIIILIILIFSVFNYVIIQRKNKEISSANFELTNAKNDLIFLNNSLEIKVNDRTNEILLKNEELGRKNKEIRMALIEGQTVEREIIATQIHDNLGSTISAIKWRIEALKRSDFNEKEKKIYDDTLNMLKNVYSDVRNLSHNLVPEVLSNLGLVGAMKKVLTDLSINQIKFDLQTNLDGKTNHVDKKVEIELFSVFLESLNNIIKYSKAQKVEIRLLKNKQIYLFEIEDDGVGFDANGQQGNGLKNIEKRIKSIDGTFSINSSASGVKTSITVPIEVHI